MIGRPKGSSTAGPAGLAAQKRHFMSKCDCPGPVTLDLDFGNPLRFDPSRYSGIAVPGLPPRLMAGDFG